MGGLAMSTPCYREAAYTVDEAFVRVHINLLGKPGAHVNQIRTASGHIVILPQCGKFLRDHGIHPQVSPDNARAAMDVAAGDDMTAAALASEMAAEIYGLNVLARHIEDHDRNTTRFLICLLYTSPSPRDKRQSRMPSSA